MGEPQQSVSMQPLQESLLYFLLSEWLIAVRCHEALTGGEQCPLAVALYTAPFEHKAEVILIGALQDALLHECAADEVVQLGRELLSPPIETEVQQACLAVLLEQGDEAMVACPSIVGGHLTEDHPLHLLLGESGGKQCSHLTYMRGDHQQMFPGGDGLAYVQVALRNFAKDGQPVSSLVRPGQLHSPLGMPFCWHIGGLLS